MMNMPRWCAVLAIATLAFGLSACKSNTRCSSGNCAPPATVQEAPTFADVEPTYPPAAPTYAEAPPIPVDQGGVSKAELDAARDTADLAKQQAADLARRLAEEKAQREANEARIRDMENKISQLQTAPPAGSGQMPDMDEGPSISRIDQLMDDLRARSAADVLRDGDMVIVRVTNGFKSGSDLLKKDVQLITTLNATADALTRHPGATVAVVGHSDGDPIKKSGWESNDALSLARAQRVAQVLSDNGVNKDRISIDGQGFRSPLIANESTAADKARNRRVEIMIRM